MNLLLENPLGKSPRGYVWWLLVYSMWRYKVFSMSSDLTKPHDWGTRTSWVRTPHGMSHLAKFGCYMYRISRDIMFSVCHVIKLNYFSKGSVDYNNRRPSK